MMCVEYESVISIDWGTNGPPKNIRKRNWSTLLPHGQTHGTNGQRKTRVHGDQNPLALTPQKLQLQVQTQPLPTCFASLLCIYVSSPVAFNPHSASLTCFNHSGNYLFPLSSAGAEMAFIFIYVSPFFLLYWNL